MEILLTFPPEESTILPPDSMSELIALPPLWMVIEAPEEMAKLDAILSSNLKVSEAPRLPVTVVKAA